MGRNTQTILVRSGELRSGPDGLLSDLGYVSRRKIADTRVSNRGSCSIWIGSIGDCIILDSDFATGILGGDDAADGAIAVFQNSLLRCFPESDIAALTLNSVVGAWGFAVFKEGKLIRHQFGFDGGTITNKGPRLPVEWTYLQNSRPSEIDGEIMYRDPAHPEYDDMTDADLGNPLVPEICRSFTGFDLWFAGERNTSAKNCQ